MRLPGAGGRGLVRSSGWPALGPGAWLRSPRVLSHRSRIGTSRWPAQRAAASPPLLAWSPPRRRRSPSSPSWWPHCWVATRRLPRPSRARARRLLKRAHPPPSRPARSCRRFGPAPRRSRPVRRRQPAVRPWFSSPRGAGVRTRPGRRRPVGGPLTSRSPRTRHPIPRRAKRRARSRQPHRSGRAPQHRAPHRRANQAARSHRPPRPGRAHRHRPRHRRAHRRRLSPPSRPRLRLPQPRAHLPPAVQLPEAPDALRRRSDTRPGDERRGTRAAARCGAWPLSQPMSAPAPRSGSLRARLQSRATNALAPRRASLRARPASRNAASSERRARLPCSTRAAPTSRLGDVGGPGIDRRHL
jgi:hypothetical protein